MIQKSLAARFTTTERKLLTPNFSLQMNAQLLSNKLSATTCKNLLLLVALMSYNYCFNEL